MNKKSILLFLVAVAFCGQGTICFAAEIKNTVVSNTTTQVADLDEKIHKLKEARDQAAMNAYLAGNKADMVMETDWLAYRNAIAKQSSYQQQVDDLDAQIAELEKQKAALLSK
jgi:outer membrane murein-binding lipoprotein Lpp